MINEEEQENQDIYNLDFADELLDNDEISSLESGFMQGYNMMDGEV